MKPALQQPRPAIATLEPDLTPKEMVARAVARRCALGAQQDKADARRGGAA